MDIQPTHADHLEAINRIEQQTQFSPWKASEFERSISAQQRRAWTAIKSGQVIGYAIYNLIGPEAELLTISLAPHQQGQGLGRQLLEQTLAMLDCSTVFLEVRLSNTNARALYESLGFNEVGQRANYYPTKEGREDAVIYAKDLTLDVGA